VSIGSYIDDQKKVGMYVSERNWCGCNPNWLAGRNTYVRSVVGSGASHDQAVWRGVLRVGDTVQVLTVIAAASQPSTLKSSVISHQTRLASSRALTEIEVSSPVQMAAVWWPAWYCVRASPHHANS
jgi:hypothetical protein